MTGPLRRLFAESLIRSGVTPESINKRYVYREGCKSDCIEIAYLSSINELKSKFPNERYHYFNNDATISIDIDSIKDAITKGEDHYLICNDISVIIKLFEDYYDVTKMAYIVLSDYEQVFNLLEGDAQTSYQSYDGYNTHFRRNKITAFDRELESVHFKNYTKIHIKQTADNISDLMQCIIDRTGFFFNKSLFNWNLLLNNSRLSCVESRSLGLNSCFAEDYSRVINSSAFRRLQRKAQVFPLERYGYARTRLTHSIECASIAETLGIRVLKEFESAKFIEANGYTPIWVKIPTLLKTSATLHDMGNPPFGHFGESGISDWFRKNKDKFRTHTKSGDNTPFPETEHYMDFEEFEGNAQLLRVITRLSTGRRDYGLDLTTAALSLIIKYPVSSSEKRHLKKNNQTTASSKKIGYFKSETTMFESIRKSVGLSGYVRHPLTFLLEAADDISYLSSDIQDSYRKKLISLEAIIAMFQQTHIEGCEQVQKEVLDILNRSNDSHNLSKKEEGVQILITLHNYIRKILIDCCIRSFIDNYEAIMSGNFTTALIDDSQNGKYIDAVIRKLLSHYVYDSDEIVMTQIKSATILNKLFDTFIPVVLSYNKMEEDNNTSPYSRLYDLLPDNYKYVCEKINSDIDCRNISEDDKLSEKTYNKVLLVTDYVCGMTDTYAREMYDLIMAND